MLYDEAGNVIETQDLIDASRTLYDARCSVVGLPACCSGDFAPSAYKTAYKPSTPEDRCD